MFPFPFSFLGSAVAPDISVEQIANAEAMSFNGTDAYVNANSLSSTLQPLTVGSISMWWNPVDATPSSGNCLFSVSSTSVNNDYFALYNLSNGKFYAQFKDNGNNRWILETDAAAFSDNTWHHIVITQNGTAPELYVNGSKPAQTFTLSVNVRMWWNNITIDQVNIGLITASGGTSGISNGKIDEVAVFNTALSPSKIQQIYDATAVVDGVPQTANLFTGGLDSSLVYWNRMGDS